MQEYKRNYNKKRSFTIATAQITNKEVVQAEVIELEEGEEYVYVPVYEGTQEEYKKYIKARRERVKEKWANARKNMEEER